MKTTIMSALGVLLIAGSVAQVTPAFARNQAPAASFRNAYNSADHAAPFAAQNRETPTTRIPTTRHGPPGALSERGIAATTAKELIASQRDRMVQLRRRRAADEPPSCLPPIDAII